MVDSQPMEEEFQGAATRDVGTETHREPTEPVLQTQKTHSPSPTFIKENIDVLRTTIKKHDQQAKMKATLRKLAYADSDKDALALSLAKSKSQKTPSRNKEPIHLRMSRRLEEQSITKEKVRKERSKSKRKSSEHQEASSNSEYEEGGAARNWFNDLEPISVDSFDKSSHKFLEEYSQQKRYAKDPTKIHGIKRRQNEGLQAFMDGFKSESSHIKGVPPVLRISAFMNGHGHSELAKKLNDKIPQTVDEMFKRVREFIRG
ncbi:reverse transcriptase domain-containing protein [Tanacetum coccineum]